MKSLFADTFYWIALTDPRDKWRKAALEVTQERNKSQIVTTDEVLDEYLAFFSGAAPQTRIEAGRTVRYLLEHSGLHVVPQSRRSFESGLALYQARPDKGYSLTDCISMGTMRRLGISEALTNDRHFEQEGFQALFRQMS